MYFPYAGYHGFASGCKRCAILGVLLVYILAVLSLITYLRDAQQRNVAVVGEGVPYNSGKSTRRTQFTKNCSVLSSFGNVNRMVALSNDMDLDAQLR